MSKTKTLYDSLRSQQSLALKTQITYGPINSRRLGRSLGINLLPASRKWCPFDCLYCQYGWTPTTNEVPNSKAFPTREAVVQAVEKCLRSLPEPPAYLTFSGNGEPTLHPDFPHIVDDLLSLRERLTPDAKVALLSNAATIGDPAIRSAISKLDCAILKLDTGNEQVFHSFNRPLPTVEYNEIVGALSQMRGITLQSLFAAGPQGNFNEKHLSDWSERVEQIRPKNVQIYSLSRPVPCVSLTLVSQDDLLLIRNRLIGKGIPAEVF